MKRLLFAFALFGLVACGPMHQLTPAQQLESADTAASVAYTAVADAADAYAAANPVDAHRAAALKDRAWDVLQRERTLYSEGKPIADLVSQLQDLATQAKGLKSP